MEKLELCIIGGNVKSSLCYRRQHDNSFNYENLNYCMIDHPIYEYLSKVIKSRVSKRCWHYLLHYIIIHNVQDVEQG